MGVRWTKAARARFLEALRVTGNVSAAARRAGVSRSYVYRRRRADARFAADWNDAEQEAVDLLEQEARRRAVEGVAEPLMGGGKLMRDEDGRVIEVRKYNDRLLEMLLKAHRPERYRDRADSQPQAAEPRPADLPAVRIVIGTDDDAASQAGDGPDDSGD